MPSAARALYLGRGHLDNPQLPGRRMTLPDQPALTSREGHTMNSADFEAQLKEAGHCEIATKMMDPRPANGEHGHEFSVRGLVTAAD